MTRLRLLLLLAAGLLCMQLASCGGGGAANTGPGNPWTGTRITKYTLMGDEPTDFRGQDGPDELIQAQLRQALEKRTYELDLYEVENPSGALQSINLHDANIISYLYQATPVFQIPGAISVGAVDTRLEFQLAEPTFAWESLDLRGYLSTVQLRTNIDRLRPIRHLNPVSGEPFIITWQATGMNGSRLVEAECKQTLWLYARSELIP